METINLRGLKEEDSRLLKKLVEFLRARSEQEESRGAAAEDIVYHSWPLRVTGIVSREEIYDYL